MADPDETTPDGSETENDGDPGDDPNEGDPGDAFDRDRAMATIRKLRAEVKDAKAQAKRVDELEKKLQEREDADKTEEQRRAERLAALETEQAESTRKLRDLRLQLAVHERAAELEIADPALAVAALDRAKVAFDDDGDPTNLDEILRATLDRHPALKATATGGAGGGGRKSGGTDGGSGGTGSQGPSLTAEELDAAKAMGMSPERYAAFKGGRSIDDLRAAREKTTATT